MDRLAQVLNKVKAQFAKLGASQRLLMISLGLILALTLVLVAMYAGKPAMVELMPVGGNQALLASLRAGGIEAEERNGAIVVPSGLQSAALAHLGQNGQLPADTTLLFSNILESQSWQNSREQNRQIHTIALQNELAKVISEYRGIREAKVFLSVPEAAGLGTVYRQPTAAVTVFTDSGASIDQATVDAVGHQIAGAVAGLDVGNVRVIDGATGQQRRPRREGDMIATTALELSLKYEDQTRQKIGDMLGYIPGVIIAVTAQVDASKREGQEHRYFSQEEGGTTSFVTHETGSEQSSGTSAPGAQPGPRSNATADISRSGSGSGTSSETSTSETTIQPFVGSRTEQYLDPRGMTTGLAVSINVPEGYVRSIVAAESPATDGADAAPDRAALEARWAELALAIKAGVIPHVRTMTTQTLGRVPSEAEVADFVQVAMIPGDVPALMGVSGGGGGLAGLVGGGGLALGGLVDKAVLVVLGLFAIGLMFSLVKRASKPVDIPTAEELVGMPPTLETPSDLIGEADESDLAMAGIEVGEEQVKSKRMLEEVAKMVDTNPDAAARLMKQWITSEG